MLNICFNCGVYRADKVIEPQGPFAVCPECGYKQAFLRLPLLIVSGASGVGKSTVCHHLLGQLNDVVLLDSDILWRPEFDQPEDHYRDFFETWLRLCKNISQSGWPVVLFGAGVGVPENMDPCVEQQ
jgi:AAA domain